MPVPIDNQALAKEVEGACYAPNFSSVPKRGYHTLPCGLVVRDPPCCVNGVNVRCGHSKRGFVLKPPTTKTDSKYRQIIQVLAKQGCKSVDGKIGEGGEQARGSAAQRPPGKDLDRASTNASLIERAVIGDARIVDHRAGGDRAGAGGAGIA